MTYGHETIDRPSAPVPPEERELDALLAFLRRERGFDFSGYKRPSLARRLQRRMITIGLSSLAEYVSHIERNADEVTELLDVLLINATAFFRDVSAWEALVTRLPAIVDPDAETPIRVWSAGCSSGEEPYTLAMVMREALGDEAFERRVKIFATDIDEEALAVARVATYSSQSLENVPASLVEKYFTPSGDRFTVVKELRRDVVFGGHDLLREAPLREIDLLCCRNLLMYFNPATQERVLENLRFALKPTGILFLGMAEMLLSHTRLFRPLDLKLRLFVPAERLTRDDRALVLEEGARELDDSGASQLRQLAFDATPNAKIIVDIAGRVVAMNRRASQLLPIGPSDVGRAVLDLELGWISDLGAAFDKIRNERRFVRFREVEHVSASGEKTFADVDVTPLFSETGALLGMQLTFVDVMQVHQLRADLRGTLVAVEKKEAELRAVRDELEAVNDALQATKEELETTNEELQSADEDLAGLGEELQSTNKELQTMNEELRQRDTELLATTTMLHSVLDRIGAGVVVLDGELRVRVWNAKMAELFGVRAHEVFGKPFPSIAAALWPLLPLEEIAAALRAATSTKEGGLETVRTLDATDRDGKKMSYELRIAPLSGEAVFERRGVVVLVSSNAWEVG